MSDSIVTRAGNEAGGTGHRSSGRFILPPDLMNQARRRLGILTGAIGGLALVLGPLIVVLSDNPGAVEVGAISVGVTAAVSFAIFYATRSSWVSNATVLLLGLVYETLMCLSSSTLGVWDFHQQTGAIPATTFASVLIAVYPLVVPCRPSLTLTSSLIAASMAPLGLGILGWTGTIGELAPLDFVGVVIAPLASVVLAYMGSHVIHNLSTELIKARQLGSYTLERLLGRGGMGEVWRARHQMLSRPAAIKLIKSDPSGADPGKASDAQIARFEREVQMTTRLSHPNTITIFDYGRTRDGTFYYVMELLEGATLEAIVEVGGPQSPARVWHILVQVLGALEEAHGIGLIHRDIKPANIMMCTQGGKPDVAKLLDFGLVKELVTNDDVHLTSDSKITGTPLYLPPESISTPNLGDARSDLYSLGAVAYFLLTGEHLFVGKSIVEICAHHLHTEPMPPSERLGSALPPELERLVLQCLEKDPVDRPKSAADMIEELERCELGDWSVNTARRWWDDNGETLEGPEVVGPTSRTIEVSLRP